MGPLFPAPRSRWLSPTWCLVHGLQGAQSLLPGAILTTNDSLLAFKACLLLSVGTHFSRPQRFQSVGAWPWSAAAPVPAPLPPPCNRGGSQLSIAVTNYLRKTKKEGFILTHVFRGFRAWSRGAVAWACGVATHQARSLWQGQAATLPGWRGAARSQDTPPATHFLPRGSTSYSFHHFQESTPIMSPPWADPLLRFQTS